ncbi:hypothetical protein NDU88_002385 [Pleurodeles waltl]|uniref:Uncharacterized protein n=1 Tax=Pleurodeles waltl TaxID=8319 RepID=A0AAV7U9R6_PLEWA|nr:hypothetical protein NDU88_002385 [Pleurodeles waltl]
MRASWSLYHGEQTRLEPRSEKDVLGEYRACPPGSILYNLVLPVKRLFHLGVGEEELWIEAIRSIGTLSENRPAVPLGSYKVDMAPKNSRTTREKAEKGDNIITGGRPMSGAQQTRAVKEWSSGGPAGRRSVTGLVKLNSKTGGGISKDVAVMGSVDQIDHRSKNRPQPAITNIFTSAGQEKGNAGPSTQSEDMLMSAVENLELTKL